MQTKANWIVETAHEHDGKLIFHKSQDVEAIIRQAKIEAELAPSMHGDAAIRKVGTIPLVIAEEWARECGCPIGTPGFAHHAKKKLMDGDFAAFRVKGI